MGWLEVDVDCVAGLGDPHGPPARHWHAAIDILALGHNSGYSLEGTGAPVLLIAGAEDHVMITRHAHDGRVRRIVAHAGSVSV